jgi:hypothetical protein
MSTKPFAKLFRMAAVVALLAIAIPHSVSASTVTPTLVLGNPTCASLNANWLSYKLDFNPATGEYTNSTGTLKIQITHVSDSTIDWSLVLAGTINGEPIGGIDAVIMKGSNQANVYFYNPESSS